MQPFLQWKRNEYCTTCVCICSLRYPACNAHAPYCNLWAAPLRKLFPLYEEEDEGEEEEEEEGEEEEEEEEGEEEEEEGEEEEEEEKEGEEEEEEGEEEEEEEEEEATASSSLHRGYLLSSTSLLSPLSFCIPNVSHANPVLSFEFAD